MLTSETYYFIRDEKTNHLLKGTNKVGNCPPKLYTLCTAKQVQSFREKIDNSKFTVIPVKVMYDI